MITPLARALAFYRAELLEDGLDGEQDSARLLQLATQRAELLRDYPPEHEAERFDHRRECLLLALLLELQRELFPEDLDPLLHLGLRSITYPQEVAAFVAPINDALEHLPEPRRTPLRDTLALATLLATFCGAPPWCLDALEHLKPHAIRQLRALLNERLHGVPGTHLSEEELRAAFDGGYLGDTTTSQALPLFAILLALHHLGDLQPHEPDPAWDDLFAAELPLCANAFFVFHFTNNTASDPLVEALLLFPEERRVKLLCSLSSLRVLTWFHTAPTAEVSKHLAVLLRRSAEGHLNAPWFADPFLSPDILQPFGAPLIDALLELLPTLPDQPLNAELPSALLALATPEHAPLLLAEALRRPRSTLRNLLLLAVVRLPTAHLLDALPPQLLTPEHLPALANLAAVALWRRGDPELARDLLRCCLEDLAPQDAQHLQSALEDDLTALRPFVATFLDTLTRAQPPSPHSAAEAEAEAEAFDALEDHEDYDNFNEEYYSEDSSEDDNENNFKTPEEPPNLQHYAPPADLDALQDALDHATPHTLIALGADTFAWPDVPFALWARLLHTSAPRLDTQTGLHAAHLLQGQEALQRAALLIAREAPHHPRLRLLYLWLTEQRPDDTDLHLLLLESASLIVQDVALTALLKNADPELPRRLGAHLQHRHAHTRAAAARALENRRDLSALPLLRAALAAEKAKAPREALQTAIAVLDPTIEDPRSIAADAGTWEHLDALNPQELLAQLRDLLHATPTALSFARALDLVARLHLSGDATPGVHYLLGHGLQTWEPHHRFTPAGFELAPDLHPLYDALHQLNEAATTPGLVIPIALLHTPRWRARLQPHIDALNQGDLPQSLLTDLLDLFLRATHAAWSWCRRHQLPLDTLQLCADSGGWYESSDGFADTATTAILLHSAFAAHILHTDPFDWGQGPRISTLRIDVPSRHPVRSHVTMKPRQRVLHIEPAWLGLDLTLPGAPSLL